MEFTDKLEQIELSFVRLEERMADPAVASDPTLLQKLAKEHSDLSDVVRTYREYKKIKHAIEDARDLIASGDKEMIELAHEEISEKEPQLAQYSEELKFLLLPKDPNDKKSVIVEIRGGAGGEEAALFAANLFRMYSRFAERQRWHVEIMSSNITGIGGYKEIAFRVDGKGAYSQLKYESGVHRVQRVPVTESGGRIHTSTATVAVLPEAEDVDVEVNNDDLKIDTYRSSGAGGQHVNMTDSAVRITHLPTGIVVTCQDERSQIKNRAKAMNLLRTKLYDMELNRMQNEQAQERRGQIGTGDRSERIRTYNYPQNRITDHRINLTLYKLDSYLDGDLFEMIESLEMADQTERLKMLETKD